jgi:ATPase subunit of ABC transporter with duplicated ATPase domains
VNHTQRLATLSGGFKLRVLLAQVLISGPDLVLLDEPTNHLDIPSGERLEQCLLDYGSGRDAGGHGGALLLITHDRALLDAVCDRLVILDGEGGATVFEGGYREWLERKSKGTPAPAAKGSAPAAKAPQKAEQKSAPKSASPTKPAGGSKGGKTDPLSRLSLEELESRIERCESDIKRIDAAMLDPANFADPAKSRKLASDRDRLAGELEPLEFEWSRRAEMG